MNIGFINMVTNLGMSFESIIILILLFAGLVFYASDFKLGLIMHMIAFACVFIWFYQIDLNWAVPLTLFFMCLIALSFTLYAVSRTTQRGAFI